MPRTCSATWESRPGSSTRKPGTRRSSAPLLIGADFGLTPAAIVGQELVDGRWLVIDEFVLDDIRVVRFAEQLASYVARTYPEFVVAGGYGNPAGKSTRVQR
jgi:hypothetical protein